MIDSGRDPVLPHYPRPTWSEAMRDTSPDAASTGVELIAAERRGQIDREGCSPRHDDDHEDRSLWRAGVAYATGNRHWWPWEPQGFKPESVHEECPTMRDLVRAGALIAAEIDRLIREASRA